MKELNVNKITTTTANLISSTEVMELLKTNTNLEIKEYIGTTNLLITTHNYQTTSGEVVSVVVDNGLKFAIIVDVYNNYHTLVGSHNVNTREELDSLVGMELVIVPNSSPYYRVLGRTGTIILTDVGPKIIYGNNEVSINLINRTYTLTYHGNTTHGELDTIWEKTCIELVNKIMS